MHAALELQLGEDSAALDLRHDLLEAARRSFADREDLDLPAMEVGVA